MPFHAPAVRLRNTAVPMAPALLLVWLPAGIGILAISWSALTFKVHGGSMDAAVAVLQAIAIATLLLGAIGALLRDELSEIAVYSILADAAFVLLALAARSDAAAEPARLWLLVFVAAKTGLVAWAAAVARACGSSRLDELHGWARRTPLLGLALAAITLATVGWPGSPVYEARASLVHLGLPGQLGLLTAAAALLSLAYVGRLLVVGLLSASDTVRAGSSEWPHRPHRIRAATEEAGADPTPDELASQAVAAASANAAVEPERRKPPRPRPRPRMNRPSANAARARPPLPPSRCRCCRPPSTQPRKPCPRIRRPNQAQQRLPLPLPTPLPAPRTTTSSRASSTPGASTGRSRLASSSWVRPRWRRRWPWGLSVRRALRDRASRWTFRPTRPPHPRRPQPSPRYQPMARRPSSPPRRK